MMKNSSLLKWTNNKNNKNKNGNKNWIHPPEALQGGHIAYLVKFLGSTEVSESKGIEVVKEAITKLRFTQQIRKTEGTKTPKVELTISVDGVAIQQPKSKKILSQYPLHQISYCADDKAEKRFFSFISKEADREAHTCFVFVSDKLAEEITLTIGQAFDLAYRRFLETSTREGELRRQVSSLKSQLEAAEEERKVLRERLSHVAALKERHDVEQYMRQNGISDLLFVNGTQSVEEPMLHHSTDQPIIHSTSYPIIHSSTNQQSEDQTSPTISLPPVPPRNGIKSEASEDPSTSEDDFDFDPRAEEGKPSPLPLPLPPSLLSPPRSDIMNGTASPESTTGDDDFDFDDFDPRAEEASIRNENNNGDRSSSTAVFEGKGSSSSSSSNASTLQLNGISNFPTLVPPPPRPTRQQDKLIPSPLLEGGADPFSSPPPPHLNGTDLLSQFDQMKVGFSRGLSFGTADNDFSLDSLDPLKNK